MPRTTHHQRIARGLAKVTDLTYQQALEKVTAASAAGLLPSPLDKAGVDQAVTLLAAGAFAVTAHQSRVLVVWAAHGGYGRSGLVFNIAQAASAAGHSVLLVDANETPTLAKGAERHGIDAPVVDLPGRVHAASDIESQHQKITRLRNENAADLIIVRSSLVGHPYATNLIDRLAGDGAHLLALGDHGTTRLIGAMSGINHLATAGTARSRQGLIYATSEQWQGAVGTKVEEWARERVSLHAAVTGAPQSGSATALAPATDRILDWLDLPAGRRTYTGATVVSNVIPFDGVFDHPHGLVLVTGPTGTGKTTAMYETALRLAASGKQVVTVEDRIERDLGFAHGEGTIRQVETRRGEQMYDEGRFLRSDPDVVIFSEMRSHEDVALALLLSETGYLVIAGLHAPSADDAIGRVTDTLPASEQRQARRTLAVTLRAVVVMRRENGKRSATTLHVNDVTRQRILRPSALTLILGQAIGMKDVEWAVGADDNHVLTITGPVGTGKTTLAQDLARQARDQGAETWLLDGNDPDVDVSSAVSTLLQSTVEREKFIVVDHVDDMDGEDRAAVARLCRSARSARLRVAVVSLDGADMPRWSGPVLRFDDASWPGRGWARFSGDPRAAHNPDGIPVDVWSREAERLADGGDPRPARIAIPNAARDVPAAVAVDLRRIATFLRAGVAPVQAIREAAQCSRTNPTRQMLDAVADAVAGGALLSEALRAHPDLVEEWAVRVVASGERAGIVVETLLDLAETLAREAA